MSRAVGLRALAHALDQSDISVEIIPSRRAQRADGGAFVLADGRGLAERVDVAARALGLVLRGALVIAPNDVARAACVLAGRDAAEDLIIALHGSPTLDALRAFAAHGPHATLLAVGDARRITDARVASEAFDTLGVCRALGLIVCDVPAIACDAHALARCGLASRGQRVVDVVCAGRDVARLMRDVLVDAGLRLGGTGGTRVGGVQVAARDDLTAPRSAAAERRVSAGDGGSDADDHARDDLVLVVDPALELEDGPNRVNLGATPAEPLRAAAIAAVITPRPIRRARRRCARAEARDEAIRLLDGWRARLPEMHVKELAARYGIDAPRETVARSASAAGAAAAEIGLPVVLRALGSALDDRARRLEITVTSASAARQAFRDVAASTERGLSGVLVSAQQRNAPGFSCALLFDGAHALLQVEGHAASGGSRRGVAGAPVALPDREGELAVSAALAHALALPRAAHAPLRAFIRALGDLGTDLADRLSWIEIARADVVVSDDAVRVELVQGHGEQRVSLRDPFG